ncbi:MAG: hypothetical protein LBM04_06470 [Opitutaceae bacterium]|nr:hypothetical protein [Opitutaceae bacterium]
MGIHFRLSVWLRERIKSLDGDYIAGNLVAIHKTAITETGVTLKPPVIIGKNCFIGTGSYLRNGVFLVENVRIGAGCEIKSSIIFSNSAVAHFNFIGDTIVGNGVNFEAGSIFSRRSAPGRSLGSLLFMLGTRARASLPAKRHVSAAYYISKTHRGQRCPRSQALLRNINY